MTYYANFLNKALKDENLVEVLNKMNIENWEKLSIEERVNLACTFFDCVCNVYSEFSGYKLRFYFDEPISYGISSKLHCLLNGSMLEERSPFEFMFTCLHELRHHFQDIACDDYVLSGSVHESFDEDLILSLLMNIRQSSLEKVNNYIDNSDIDHYEYMIQPVEYDAEHFSFAFMDTFIKEFLINKEDIEECNSYMNKYSKYYSHIMYNQDDIINFNNIYKLNYEDRVFDNSHLMRSDNIEAERYFEMLEDVESIKDEDLLCFFAPSLWKTCDVYKKEELINRYFASNDCKSKAIVEDNEIFINDIRIDNYDGFKVAEVLFNFIAQEEIFDIVRKPVEELNKIEREVVINLDKDNFIKEEENPLIYNIQPYAAYKKKIILEHIKKFYNNLCEVYGKIDLYFDDYSEMYKRNDINSMNKKVRLVTGDSPYNAYKKTLKNRNKNKSR